MAEAREETLARLDADPRQLDVQRTLKSGSIG